MVFAECEPSREGLRITVGTDAEVDRFFEALDGVGS
jgi:histidinol-phosphate/aromatic aminotransferase/cobyric acid decarboxylase-like protein